jgi:hypothetical protein
MADCEIPVYWICSPSLSVIYDQTRHRRIDDKGLTWLEFLDSKLASLAMSADCFVHSPIGSATDETDYFVSIYDSDLALISRVRADAPITWIWGQVSKRLYK